LDPSGESFDYSPQDWRRLVFSFGDTGELIHPRFDSRAPLRLPGVVEEIAAEEVAEDVVESAANPVETVAEEVASADTQDLANRLDSLLDRPKS